MNVLAIDYGRKRIGLAWMQDGLDVILPFGTMNNEQGTMNELVVMCGEENIDHVVIGLPLALDGSETKGSENVRAFGKELEEKTRLPISFVDERFSSRGADALGGTSSGASRDERSAMLILETYLQRHK